MKYVLAFIFGGTLGSLGFPINTYQYWVLIIMFCINGVIEK